MFPTQVAAIATPVAAVSAGGSIGGSFLPLAVAAFDQLRPPRVDVRLQQWASNALAPTSSGATTPTTLISDKLADARALPLDPRLQQWSAFQPLGAFTLAQTPKTLVSDKMGEARIAPLDLRQQQWAGWSPQSITASVNLLNSIVAYWKFDENTGTSAADATGNGHTGTLSGVASWTTGKINSGVNFNTLSFGSGKATFSGLPAVGNAQAWSFAAWVHGTFSGSGYQTLFTQGSTKGIWLRSSAIDLYDGGADHNSSASLTDSTDHHVAVTVNAAGAVTFYIDGSPAGTSTVPLANYTFDSMGQDAGGGDGLIGWADEAGFWNRELSAAEISALYNSGAGLAYPFGGFVASLAHGWTSFFDSRSVTPPTLHQFLPFLPQGNTISTSSLLSGLVAYWKLDDGSGSTALDSTNNGNTGSLVNSPTWGSGKIGGCITLNPGATTNQQIDVAAMRSSLFAGGAASVAAWANQAAANNWAKIFSWVTDNDTAPDGISLYANDTNHMRAIAGNTKIALDPNTITNGTLIHWVATYDGSTVTLYRNGQSVASTGGGTAMGVPTKKIGIGNSGSDAGTHSTGQGFHGDIDEVGLWNRALTASEVAALYNSGYGLAYPFAFTTNSSPEGWASFFDSRARLPAPPALALSDAPAIVGSSSFDPRQLSGLQLWLDFTDSSTVTTVSGNISQINDKSGNSRNATQASAGNRPGYSAQCPNGANGGSFNGSSAYLNTTSFSLSQPFTIFCVGKSSNPFGYFHDSPSGTRVAQLWAVDSAVSNGGNYLWGWVNTNGTANGDTTVSDLNKDLVSCFVANGASSKMFINGVQRGTTGQGSGSGGISSGLRLGANQGLSFLLTGYMAHLLVYNSALSDADRQTVEAYLRSSAGIFYPQISHGWTSFFDSHVQQPQAPSTQQWSGFSPTAPASYATWNASDKTSNVTLSGSNLIATFTNNSVGGVRSTNGKSTGKYYFEITNTVIGGGDDGLGIASNAADLTIFGSAAANGTAIFYPSGAVYNNGSYSGTSLSNPGGQTTAVAVDLGNKRVWFKVGSGDWNGNASNDPATNVGGFDISGYFSSGTILPIVCADNNGTSWTANFGASAFSGTVPSGFTAGWI